jgi:UDP-hydrolysing UDP-N-acetyl-D-glucosamine 2-epimerase
MPRARSALKVAVVTGTRAEYGIWRPVLQAVAKSPRLRLQLVVTGMHLLPEFGNTWRQITADGFTIAARAPMYPRARAAATEPARSLARGIAALGDAFTRLDPDIVLVLGDRLEMLAAAAAAMAQQRILAHVHGGETAPGQFDEQIRHAITKLAHLHFAATRTAAARIVQMGEAPASVHVTGAPALDELVAFARTHAAEDRPAAPLLVLHPSSPDEHLEERRATLVLRALARRWPGPLQVIGPNNDPGHRGILRAYAAAGRSVALTMNLAQQDFWQALRRHGLLVGNSSAGIIEAASLGVPVVNVGARQAGRERNTNVVDAPFTRSGLQAALATALSDRFLRRAATGRNLYGDGHAAARIVAVLARLHPLTFPRAKRFCDLPEPS